MASDVGSDVFGSRAMIVDADDDGEVTASEARGHAFATRLAGDGMKHVTISASQLGTRYSKPMQRAITKYTLTLNLSRQLSCS